MTTAVPTAILAPASLRAITKARRMLRDAEQRQQALEFRDSTNLSGLFVVRVPDTPQDAIAQILEMTQNSLGIQDDLQAVNQYSVSEHHTVRFADEDDWKRVVSAAQRYDAARGQLVEVGPRLDVDELNQTRRAQAMYEQDARRFGQQIQELQTTNVQVRWGPTITLAVVSAFIFPFIMIPVAAAAGIGGSVLYQRAVQRYQLRNVEWQQRNAIYQAAVASRDADNLERDLIAAKAEFATATDSFSEALRSLPSAALSPGDKVEKAAAKALQRQRELAQNAIAKEYAPVVNSVYLDFKRAGNLDALNVGNWATDVSEKMIKHSLAQAFATDPDIAYKLQRKGYDAVAGARPLKDLLDRINRQTEPEAPVSVQDVAPDVDLAPASEPGVIRSLSARPNIRIVPNSIGNP